MIFEFILVVLLVELNQGKVYDRCELARELKFVHNAPSHQLATWVCIAEHESQFNTSIVGHLNGDGSGDHGIFQISDKYWCSPPGKGYACGVTCAELEDDDISDDYQCAEKIYKEHKQLSGDGFNAWAVYQPHCKGLKAESHLKNCFDDFHPPKTFTTPATAFAHGYFDTSRVSAQKTSYEPLLSFRSSIVQSPESSFPSEKPLRTTFTTPKSTFFDYRFFTSTENPNAHSFFTPTTRAPTTSRTFVPTTSSPISNSVIFHPTTTTVPTVSTSSIFEFDRRFSSPLSFSQSSPLFSSSTVTYPAPIFIINGVKWY